MLCRRWGRLTIAFLFFQIIFNEIASAQYDAPLYTSYTTRSERQKLYARLVDNTIKRNLSIPLSDSTEDRWMDAFDGIQLLVYKNNFIKDKLGEAIDQVSRRSKDFQEALVETLYAVYPKDFSRNLSVLLTTTASFKLFALCAEYLMANELDETSLAQINLVMQQRFDTLQSDPSFIMLQHRLTSYKHPDTLSNDNLHVLLSRQFLPGKTVMFSFQRKNRNYPGLAIVRDPAGNFISDSMGVLFSVPQLARSINNLPVYMKGGNTPQGIFLMYGFGVSMSKFIGPSANIQMGMPVEMGISRFMADLSILDTNWNLNYYERLIPYSLRNYFPLYESYYAGAAGRNEIIAHGTAIDPQYYVGQPYYPMTPSMGCLCTRELWDGKRLASDQQQLVNALLQAGGGDGYCVVIELDDKMAPVKLSDVEGYIAR